MAPRPFTVFMDQPSTGQPSVSPSRVTRSANKVLAVRTSSLANVKVEGETKAMIEKENYDPFTGKRVSAATAGDKKRKTVLAAKAIPVPPTAVKKEKPGAPEPKKRKTSTVTTKKAKAPTSKKEFKSTTSARKIFKRSTPRRVPSLPKVTEEDGSRTEDVDQAAIDSRCYALTVKPLADVSAAYETAESPTESVSASKGPFQTIREASVEPELRDYFAPRQRSVSVEPTQLTRLIEEEDDKPNHVFSTPERKRIYSAFTFSSPSPSSKCFRD